MAATKISALTALAVADVDPAVDVFAIVDTGVSTTKKILASAVVLTAQNQTIGGVKTFSDDPVITGGAVFRKNALINGDFQVWPEGTSFAAIATGTYFAEMWKYQKVGAMVHTVSQSSDVPTIAESGRKIPYSLLIDCTTVDAAIAAGDFASIQTYIEGYNFVYIAGVGLCCQFWHKHTKTGIYCVAFTNGSDRSFVREYTQDVTDTWEFASVLVDATPTAGTWDYTNQAGLQVFFTLAAGTDFQGVAGTWNSAVDLATSNQVNACDNTANNFRLAGVQLEKGSVATEFEFHRYQDVLNDCKRYYRAYNSIVGVGNLAGTSGYMIPAATSIAPQMRTTATVSFNVGGTTTFNYANGSGVITYSTINGSCIDTESVGNFTFTGLSAAIVVGEVYYLIYVGLSARF